MIVSFDFDDTLLFCGGSSNVIILDKLREHHKAGHTCVIVTARSRQFYSIKEIDDFIIKHNLVINAVYFTNHELKGPTLKHIGAEVHYDDAEHHLDSCVECGVKAFKVDGFGNFTEWKPKGNSFQRVLDKFKEL